MMFFAGAFALRPQTRLPIGLKAELELALSRRPRPVAIHDAGPFFLAGGGINVKPTFELDGSGSLSALSGDALIVEYGKVCSHRRQLALLHAAARERQTNLFRQARGTYSFIHYNAPEQRLWLGADRVGLRPIYYTLKDDVLVFASALRILEAVSIVHKRLSLEGMAELCGLEYPLGERTPYENIFVLRESEVVEVTEKGVSRQTYDDWSEPDAAPQDLKANAANLAEIFKAAVDLRIGGERNAYAYLSGGLDSRSIVALLLARGIDVIGLNFSPAGSQDQAFAAGFAREAGPSLHLHSFGRRANPNFSLLASQAIATLPAGEQLRSSIWSGDGGSVGLGHVYMNEAMLDRLEAGDLDGTARLFMTADLLGLPDRIFTGPVRKRLEGYLVQAITAELKRRPRRDRARSLYLFLLFNDQRRHLFKHFETMDEHGLEFVLPFYDADFLQAVAATPVRSGILHRLYMAWFEHLPSFVRASPWQTYPGHVPCPLSTADDIIYQWATSPAKERLPARLETAQAILESLAASDLPPNIFSRAQLTLAATTHLAGARDYTYVLEIVRQFRMHQSRCNSQSLAALAP